LTDPVLEPRYGLGRYLAQGWRIGADAEAQELALPWPSHRALLDVDFELQVPRDKRADTRHHSLPRPCAGRVDIAVIGVTHELMAAPL